MDQLDTVVAVLEARFKGDGTHRAHLDWWRHLPKDTADARSLDEFKGRAVKMCIGGF